MHENTIEGRIFIDFAYEKQEESLFKECSLGRVICSSSIDTYSSLKMKKHSLVLLLAIAFSSLSYAEALRLSEPVHQDDTSETFGALIEELPPVTQLATILESPQTFIGKPLAVETKVSKVCQMKGCFFIAQYAGKSIRVTFKDYGFFVPTDIAGRKVMLIGELIQNEVSDAQAAHLSKDLGEQGSVKRGVQYQLVASSVRVPK